MRFDPYQDIDPEAWQAIDESERIELVRQYRRSNRIGLPNENLHAAIHAIVENQVALGDTFPVRPVLLRLMDEGLDRHEAVYAIGSVLAKQFLDVLKGAGGADLKGQLA